MVYLKIKESVLIIDSCLTLFQRSENINSLAFMVLETLTRIGASLKGKPPWTLWNREKKLGNNCPLCWCLYLCLLQCMIQRQNQPKSLQILFQYASHQAHIFKAVWGCSWCKFIITSWLWIDVNTILPVLESQIDIRILIKVSRFHCQISGSSIWGPACTEGAYKCMVKGNGKLNHFI